MHSELWAFLLGIWVWQGVVTMACLLSGGYTWSLLRTPNGNIVRVWPQRKYRYKRSKVNLVDGLSDVGYNLITQDDARGLIRDFGKNPWKSEDFRGRVSVRYTPWVIAKKFPKLVVTKELLQRVVEERRKWEESEGDED